MAYPTYQLRYFDFERRRDPLLPAFEVELKDDEEIVSVETLEARVCRVWIANTRDRLYQTVAVAVELNAPGCSYGADY